jgi:hypothetical protein
LDKDVFSGRQNSLISDLLFLSFAVVEFSSDFSGQKFFIAFHDYRKLKQPTRVRASAKFYHKYDRQLLVSGRYSFIDLICIREEGNRSYIYYKKDRHPYISVRFSGIFQEFRKLISY